MYSYLPNLATLHRKFFILNIYIFLLGNVYISTVKLKFKRHWMSLVWIALVYYKRDMDTFNSKDL